jgi:hypothetical protein
MDFNAGTSGVGGAGGSPLGPGGGLATDARGAAGAEFRYTDPVPPSRRLRPRRPASGDFVTPSSFAIICFDVSATLADIGAVARSFSVSGIYGDTVPALMLAAIGLFVGAGIAHLLVMLIVGLRNAGFEGPSRVSAYSSVTSRVSWIP